MSKDEMNDPLIVVYSRSNRVFKAIPFSSGCAYVLGVASDNPRSDVASELATVKDAVAYEAEAGVWDIDVICYSDTTDYGNHLIYEAKCALGWE